MLLRVFVKYIQLLKVYVRKFLSSLPKTWKAKVTTIQEAKDLTKLPQHEPIGSLMTHEHYEGAL